MKTRGRHSAASQVIAGGFTERPEPPKNLTLRQNAIWREVVASEDPNFFNTGVLRGLLADYCRSRATAEGITAVIEASAEVWMQDSESVANHERLLRMRDRELKAMVTVATKLRLTNQSRYVPHTAATAAKKTPKEDLPWRKSA
jgi:hypothetical protein